MTAWDYVTGLAILAALIFISVIAIRPAVGYFAGGVAVLQAFSLVREIYLDRERKKKRRSRTAPPSTP